MKLVEQLKIVPLGCVGWHALAVRRAVVTCVASLQHRVAERARRRTLATRHGLILTPSALAIVGTSPIERRLVAAATPVVGSSPLAVASSIETGAAIAKLLDRFGRRHAASDLRTSFGSPDRCSIIVLIAAEGRSLRVYWIMSLPMGPSVEVAA